MIGPSEIVSVEFVDYQEVLSGLAQQGYVEVEDEEQRIRLELDPNPALATHHFRDPASQVVPYPEATVSECSREKLPSMIEQIIGRMHLREILAIPVEKWRDIVDCVAFDLASDEEWQEIDAIAAVHQNTRNALAITRAEQSVLMSMIAALFSHADGPRHDLTLVSDVKPVLIEVFHDGAVSLTCENGFMAELLKAIDESKAQNR